MDMSYGRYQIVTLKSFVLLGGKACGVCGVVVCGNRNFDAVSVLKNRTEPNFICETVFYSYRGVVKNRQ